MLTYIINKFVNLFYNFIEPYNAEHYLETTYNVIQVFLSSEYPVQFYNKFSLMESFLLLDGIICSMYFLRDFLILKLSFNKMERRSILLYNEEIVN